MCFLRFEGLQLPLLCFNLASRSYVRTRTDVGETGQPEGRRYFFLNSISCGRELPAWTQTMLINSTVTLKMVYCDTSYLALSLQQFGNFRWHIMWQLTCYRELGTTHKSTPVSRMFHCLPSEFHYGYYLERPSCPGVHILKGPF